MASFSGKSMESEGGDRWKSSRMAGLPMINNDYTSDPGSMVVAVHGNCELQSGEVKGGMDLSLLFLHRQGLAGRPRLQARPTCRSQGSSRRSGRFPALPYPPLKQMGLVGS